MEWPRRKKDTVKEITEKPKLETCSWIHRAKEKSRKHLKSIDKTSRRKDIGKAKTFRRPSQNVLSEENPSQNVLSVENPLQNVLSQENPSHNVLSVENPSQNVLSQENPSQNVLSEENPLLEISSLNENHSHHNHSHYNLKRSNDIHETLDSNMKIENKNLGSPRRSFLSQSSLNNLAQKNNNNNFSKNSVTELDGKTKTKMDVSQKNTSRVEESTSFVQSSSYDKSDDCEMTFNVPLRDSSKISCSDDQPCFVPSSSLLSVNLGDPSGSKSLKRRRVALSNDRDNFVKLTMRKNYRGKSGKPKKLPEYIRPTKYPSKKDYMVHDKEHRDCLEELLDSSFVQDFKKVDDFHTMSSEITKSDSKNLPLPTTNPIPSLPLPLPPNEKSLTSQLRLVFKHPNFKSGQKWAIERILKGENALLILPTGAGKSLCYQLPSLYLTGLTLVISPLVSLMNDQIRNLPPEIGGATLSGQQSLEELSETLQNIRSGKIKIVFLSPERLLSSSFQRLASFPGSLPPIDLVCIDEAHCLSEWSHNFRPSYLRLKQTLCGSLKPKSILAMTATASQKVVEDIRNLLEMDTKDIWREDWERSNLKLCIQQLDNDEERYQKTFSLLSSPPYNKGSIIVYVHQQKQTEAVADFLTAQGIVASPYHAGIEQSKRLKTQNGFLKGRIRVVVATVAFGMGIDKKNVRGILHFHLPNSIEHYVQEIGRAGRDGNDSYCHLFLVKDDFIKRHSLSYSDGVDISSLHRLLHLLFRDNHHRILHENHVQVTLPIQSTEIHLDMKSSVIETVLVLLSMSSIGVLEMMPSLCATCTVSIRNSMLDQMKNDLFLQCLNEISQIEDIEEGYLSRRSFKCNLLRLALKWKNSMDDRLILQQLRQLKRKGILLQYTLEDFSFRLILREHLDDQQLKNLEKLLDEKLQEVEANAVQKVLDLYKIVQSSVSSQGDIHSYLLGFQNKSKKQFQNKSNQVEENGKRLIQKIGAYFDGLSVDDQENRMHHERKPMPNQFISKEKEDQLRCSIERDTQAILSGSGGEIFQDDMEKLTPRSITRFFHGLSSPAFPASFCRENSFWGKYANIDFGFVIECIRQQHICTNK